MTSGQEDARRKTVDSEASLTTSSVQSPDRLVMEGEEGWGPPVLQELPSQEAADYSPALSTGRPGPVGQHWAS